MSKVPLKNVKGDSVGDYEVADGLLLQDKGAQAVHEAVVAYLAHQRAGTASTKSKSEVAGSGKKPWAQKGSGRARAGYKQSPVWRGGRWRMVHSLGNIRKKFLRRLRVWHSVGRLARRWRRAKCW